MIFTPSTLHPGQAAPIPWAAPDLCDVAPQPQQEQGLFSGVHAELLSELQGDGWRVSLEDHSSQGTLVNNV